MHRWLFFVLATLLVTGAAQAQIVVEQGSAMQFLANTGDPGIGLSWTDPDTTVVGWGNGVYGIGYGAGGIIQTFVPVGTRSVYTRASFNVPDASAVSSVLLGIDYDDGVAAWINGVEVYRSPEMPGGALAWNSTPGLHESSNGPSPVYTPRHDVTALALPELRDGTNLLAVGVWNQSTTSSDLALVPQLALDLPTFVSRGPYLQMGMSDEITVRWRTEGATESTVMYGTQQGNLTDTVTVAGTRSEHEVTLTSLIPNTLYYYGVGSPGTLLAGDDADHFFVTAPTPGTSKPTRIWTHGDFGTANADAELVRNGYLAFTGSTYTDLWLMLGDNAYPDGSDVNYQEAVFETYPSILRQTVAWSTMGNHDGISASAATQTGPYYDTFTFPTAGEVGGVASGTEAYYSFDYANIHFICLESHETDRSVGGDMLDWLVMDLDQVTADWIIAFWHHPPYSKGSHNSDLEIRLIEMRENALPILENGGVDLVLTGHSHSYERSFLIDGHYGASTTFVEAMKKDGGNGRISGDGAYIKPLAGGASHEGAVYVVAGSGGRLSASGTLDHPVMFASMRTLGSVVLDIDGNQLDAQFLDGTGNALDWFTLVRSDVVGAPTPEVIRLTRLRSIHPNPFNPRTSIEFSLAEPGDTEVDVYNLRGERVRSLVRAHYPAGSHVVSWSGVDDTGSEVASGVYLVELRANGHTDRRKMTLVR